MVPSETVRTSSVDFDPFRTPRNLRGPPAAPSFTTATFEERGRWHGAQRPRRAMDQHRWGMKSKGKRTAGARGENHVPSWTRLAFVHNCFLHPFWGPQGLHLRSQSPGHVSGSSSKYVIQVQLSFSWSMLLAVHELRT